jgi:GAF domain-containing protein
MNAKGQLALQRATDEPELLWRKAELAISEANLARETARRQIEQLPQDTGCRRRYRDAMLSKILVAAIARTHAGMGNIQLFDQRSGSLVIQTHEGFRKPFLDYFSSVESGQAACGAALRLRNRVIVDDVTQAEIFSRGRALEVLLDSGVRSVQSTPLIGTSGQLLGVFSTHRSFTGRPNAKELSVLDYFAAWTAALIEWHSGE